MSDGGLGSRDWDSLVSVPSPQSLISVGADIERIECRGPEFAADFFTATELTEVEAAKADQRDTVITAIWSAKEAALKALRLGLTVDTRHVSCSPTLTAMPTWDGWASLTVAAPALLPAPGRLIGWGRTLDDYVLTLVVKYEV